jgi:hypothetical protein
VLAQTMLEAWVPQAVDGKKRFIEFFSVVPGKGAAAPAGKSVG